MLSSVMLIEPWQLRSMPSSIDLQAAYAESGVADVLEQLDRELIGLAPVEPFPRPCAAQLFAIDPQLLALL